jgi:hypothetical protein
MDLSLSQALHLLRCSGLCAEESPLYPGGILGGRSQLPFVLNGRESFCVQDSFLIRPEGEAWAWAVPGVGLFDEELAPTLLDAVSSVTSAYLGVHFQDP